MRKITVTSGLQSVEMDVLKFSAYCRKSGISQRVIDRLLDSGKDRLDINDILKEQAKEM